jgi:uncharacterized protein (TIGR02996 family)
MPGSANDEAALLASIREHPDDDARRLVYADWLDDHGDPQRAAFIRVQCRLAALDEDDPQRRELQRQEYELLAEHGGAWAAAFVGQVGGWRFRRGFVEWVKAEPAAFAKAAKWMAAAPVDEVDVRPRGLDEAGKLFASPQLRRVRRLDLDHAKLGDEGVSMLASSPNVANLTHLSLRFTGVGREGLLGLARSPQLRSLRSLDVEANWRTLRASDFTDFVSACTLPALERFAWDTAVGPDGFRALAASPLGRRLTASNLKVADVAPEGPAILADPAAFPRLSELTLRDAPADVDPAPVLEALSASPLLGRLTSLALVNAKVSKAAVRALARAGRPGPLRRLDLSRNGIDRNGLRPLFDSPLCDSLTRLVLSGNAITDSDVTALAASAHLGNLHHLDLSDCKRVTSRGLAALLASPIPDRLSYLGLEGVPVGKTLGELGARLGERFDYGTTNYRLDPAETARRVKEQPPRCVRGLGPTPETELIRRFPRDRIGDRFWPCVSFELTHRDPGQRAVLLGYEWDNPDGEMLSPYAIRWEPSGEQREFFDGGQHGKSGEMGYSCATGSGKRKPWTCGRRGCREHRFVVTFIYRIDRDGRPAIYHDRHLPFADQFYHVDVDAYCASQDRMIGVGSFECKP